MKIQYCCMTKINALGICYHNLIIDGIKKHIKDEGCGFIKDNILSVIEVNPEFIQNGWVGDCNVQCTDLN